MSPINTTNEQIDKSLDLPSHKLIFKILIVGIIVFGAVGYFVATLLKESYNERLEEYKIKLEKYENCCIDCKEERLNDVKDMNKKIDELKTIKQ